MGLGLLERAGKCHVMVRGGMEKGLHPAVASKAPLLSQDQDQ